MMLAKSISEFEVYCTSNHDSTGICVNEASNAEYNCVIIPGQLIQCLDKLKNNYECILVTQVTLTQAEFSCKLDQVNENEFQDDVDKPLIDTIPEEFHNVF